MSSLSLLFVPFIKYFAKKFRGSDAPEMAPTGLFQPSAPIQCIPTEDSVVFCPKAQETDPRPTFEVPQQEIITVPTEKEPTPLPVNEAKACISPSTDLVATNLSLQECSTERGQSHEEMALNPGIPEEIRCYAILAMGKQPGARSFPVLQRLTWDPIPAVRYSSARSLQNFPGIMALPLLRRLMKDENPFVRSSAVHSIGSWKTPQVLSCLFKALKDKSKLVRRTIGETILQFPGELLYPTFQKTLRRVKPIALSRGLKLLWGTQRPEAIPLLKHILKTAPAPVRRVVLRFALKTNHPSLMYDIKEAIKSVETETLSELQAYMEYCRPESINFPTLFTYVKKLETLAPLARSAHLRKLLDHADAHVRAMAVRSLGEISIDGILPELVNMLENESKTNVRVSILEILPRFKEEAEPILLKALSTNDPALMQAAARGLSEIGGQTSLNRLVQISGSRIPDSARFFVECAMEKIRERLNTTHEANLKVPSGVIAPLTTIPAA